MSKSDDVLRQQMELVKELFCATNHVYRRIMKKNDDEKTKVDATHNIINKISTIIERGKNTSLGRLIKRNHLNEEESLIVLVLLNAHLQQGKSRLSGVELLKIISNNDSVVALKNMRYLSKEGRLRKKGIISSDRLTGLTIMPEIQADYFLTSLSIREIAYGRKAIPKCKKNKDKYIINKKNIKSPELIYSELNKYVIGQDYAKKILSVAVYNHFKRIFHNNNGIEIEKSNILLIGPTGCGKTLLCKTLAKTLDVPFVITDATVYTETGYVGGCVEDMLSKLYGKAGYNLENAQRGIIYIDEIDKIATQSITKAHNSDRDVSGRSVQEELLKLIESNIISYSHHYFPDMNTKNILFIVGGAFDGLRDIINRRKKNKIGFCPSDTNKQNYHRDINKVNTEDLIEYGMIPELIGRIPVIATLEELTLDQMVDILTVPKNAILKQYQEMFRLNGVDLQITSEVLYLIAEEAINNGVGARGLRTIMEELLSSFMFHGFNSKCSHTKLLIDEYKFKQNIVKNNLEVEYSQAGEKFA
ncbi:MAG: ATP-dependent Clp protease ATP-binding subunit ClpX [Candidatus Firestonebacteria bacterium]